ncbi:hypothetical protein [Planotetraspora phitsanulokensis]|uniref:hypothetical protein n=1 Tax=Planotetraspora phitsanulokensis TaxID=575192 RepID=UPI00194FF3E8|nr:hypothetical protein [Planotetraspora phitsanulokensis]
MIDLSGLDERFARLAEEYGQRRAAAYAEAVRWEWYDDDAFDLRPLYYERSLWRPGRRLAERPPVSRDHVQIGFDADDRLVVLLEYSGFLDGTLYYETFRTHLTGIVEEARFHVADGKPIYLHEYRFEAGRIGQALIAAVAGGGYETYDYDGDRVTRVAVHHAARRRGAPLRPEPWTVIGAAYDGEGLSRLEISAPGGPAQVKYERPPAGFTVESAWRTVREELLTQIPRSVRALAVDEPAYCVALVYEDPLDPADVLVNVGLERDRVRLAGDSDPEDVWSPADMAHETPVDVRAVAGTARLLAQELTLSRSDRGGELLCEVARSLGAVDWSAILPITEDFVVYAVDLEMADLDRNMRAVTEGRDAPFPGP